MLITDTNAQSANRRTEGLLSRLYGDKEPAGNRISNLRFLYNQDVGIEPYGIEPHGGIFFGTVFHNDSLETFNGFLIDSQVPTWDVGFPNPSIWDNSTSECLVHEEVKRNLLIRYFDGITVVEIAAMTVPTNESMAGLDAELLEALNDMDGAVAEATREGFPQPSDLARVNAKRLLKDMYKISPRRFEVYPTPDAEIAIDAPNGHGASVLLLCDSDGGATCLVNLTGGQRRQTYLDTEALPDNFLRESLADLGRESS